MVLVDGPGLVMPDLTKTKASMVLAGILPVDNLTDSEAPVDLLLSDNLPASIIERHYGLIKSSESQRSLRLTPGSKLLSSLALRRGFMKPGGMPDGSRAARILLKDYAQGKLLFCRAPPGVDQATFFPLGEVESEEVEEDLSLMESFPELRIPSGVHVRGVRGMMDPTSKKVLHSQYNIYLCFPHVIILLALKQEEARESPQGLQAAQLHLDGPCCDPLQVTRIRDRA